METPKLTETSQAETAFLGLLKECIGMGETVLNISPVVLVALVGNACGEYAACADDHMAHDEEWQKKATEKLGRAPSRQPCVETMHRNFQYAYDDHMKKHNKLRVAMKEGEELLRRVCESNREGKL